MFGDASAANNDCVGRCGAGCGDWQWSFEGDTTSVEVLPPSCSMNGTDIGTGPGQEWWATSGMVHMTTGPQCSSDECAAHDGCSSNWFAELTYCNVLDPTLIDHMCDYYLTWTWDGYETVYTWQAQWESCFDVGVCCGADTCQMDGTCGTGRRHYYY
jgi:hypothetical protein